MNQEDAKLVRELIDGSRVVALGVLVDGAPYVGLLPFVMTEDRRSLLVHAFPNRPPSWRAAKG